MAIWVIDSKHFAKKNEEAKFKDHFMLCQSDYGHLCLYWAMCARQGYLSVYWRHNMQSCDSTGDFRDDGRRSDYATNFQIQSALVRECCQEFCLDVPGTTATMAVRLPANTKLHKHLPNNRYAHPRHCLLP